MNKELEKLHEWLCINRLSKYKQNKFCYFPFK